MKNLEEARNIKKQFIEEFLTDSLLKNYITSVGLSKNESGNYCLEVRLLTRPNLNLPGEYKEMMVNYVVTGKIKKIP